VIELPKFDVAYTGSEDQSTNAYFVPVPYRESGRDCCISLIDQFIVADSFLYLVMPLMHCVIKSLRERKFAFMGDQWEIYRDD